MRTDLATLTAFSVLFVALGQTLFVLFYISLPWWRTFLGRILFVKAVSFALFVDVAVGVHFLEWAGEDLLIVTLYSMVGLSVWAQLSAFIYLGRGRHQPLDDAKDREEVRQ